jgi:hypothetical protein
VYEEVEESEEEEYEEPPPARRYTAPARQAVGAYHRSSPAGRAAYVPPLQADLDRMLVDSVGWMQNTREAQRKAVFARLAQEALGR